MELVSQARGMRDPHLIAMKLAAATPRIWDLAPPIQTQSSTLPTHFFRHLS